jgi:hypothetical protein
VIRAVTVVALLLAATVSHSSASISGAAAAGIGPPSSAELLPAPPSEAIRRLDGELARQRERMTKSDETRSSLDLTLRELDLRLTSAEAFHETELWRLRSLIALVALILAVTLASLIAAWRKVTQMEERWRPPASHEETRQFLEDLYRPGSENDRSA